MRHDFAYLKDILKAAEELTEFVANTDESRLASKLEQSFVVHSFIIIGEAANAIAPEIQARYPEVPWARIVSLRNRLIHAYFDMDLPLIWNLATTQLDDLRRRIAEILRIEFPGAEEPPNVPSTSTP